MHYENLIISLFDINSWSVFYVIKIRPGKLSIKNTYYINFQLLAIKNKKNEF
jgi:hypothetical protein